MGKNNAVAFALRKITTEQFATIEGNIVDTPGEINIQTNFRFGADKDSKQIAAFTAFTFEIAGKPFLIVEAGCHFAIESGAWDAMVDEGGSLYVEPRLLQHLIVLTVGTTRGILHAKTENTAFNSFYLPTINVEELIQDGVSFDLQN